MTRPERLLPLATALALTVGVLAGVHPMAAQAAIGIDIDVAPPGTASHCRAGTASRVRLGPGLLALERAFPCMARRLLGS
jgi:hypothetical protein